MTAVPMTSNRPYLIRSMYDWISDNGLTPHILVDAQAKGVSVPTSAVNEGRVILNIASRAVINLDLGNEWVAFVARFGGVSQKVEVPISAILAVYAQENGQGMMFPIETNKAEESPSTPEPTHPPPRNSHLRVIK